MAWALSCHMRGEKVAALLDEIDKGNEGRVEFTNSMTREMALSAIHAILWAYESRAGDTSAAYAWLNLWGALRVDWTMLKFLPAQGMSPGTAETGTGSGPQDGQPGPERDAPDSPPASAATQSPLGSGEPSGLGEAE